MSDQVVQYSASVENRSNTGLRRYSPSECDLAIWKVDRARSREEIKPEITFHWSLSAFEDLERIKYGDLLSRVQPILNGYHAEFPVETHLIRRPKIAGIWSP